MKLEFFLTSRKAPRLFANDVLGGEILGGLEECSRMFSLNFKDATKFLEFPRFPVEYRASERVTQRH